MTSAVQEEIKRKNELESEQDQDTSLLSNAFLQSNVANNNNTADSTFSENSEWKTTMWMDLWDYEVEEPKLTVAQMKTVLKAYTT